MLFDARTILLYVFIFCSLVFLFKRTDKVQRYDYILLGLIVCLLIYVAVIKPPTMADYNSYVRLFYGIDQNDRMEIAFGWIVSLCNKIGGGYFFMFLVFACISILLRFILIKNYSQVIWGSLIVYLSNIYMLHDLIQIRAAVASALMLLIIHFSYKRNLRYFLITFFIALLFHYSSAIFAIIWFVTRKQTKKIYYAFIVISYILFLTRYSINTVASFFSFSQVESLLESYSTREAFDYNVFNLVQLGRIAIAVFFFQNLTKIDQYNSQFIVFLKVYTIGLCFLPLLASIPGIALRFMELFVSCEVVVVPVGFYAVFQNKLISKLVILLYSIIIFNIYFNATNYWDYVVV